MFGLFKRTPKPQVKPEELLPLNAWLEVKGFDPEDVSFSVYRDPNLMKADSTLVVVGFGNAEGSPTGFAAELTSNRLVEAFTIHPGAASYHRQVASKALYGGQRLIHGLVERSLLMNTR
jgi:hypothetical protein